MALGVEADVERLLDVGLAVDVDVADAIEVLDHRDRGFRHQARDQALAATRHDDVHVLRHGDQGADSGAVGGVDHLHAVVRQTSASQAFLDQPGQGAVAMNGFRTAAQDGGVATLDAQAGRVHRHVRTRFVNDADHAQRHAHLADLDAGRAVFEAGDFADGIRQRDDLAQAFNHGGDGLLGQRQAVQHGRRQAVGGSRFHVHLVGGAQQLGVAHDCVGDQRQCAVARGTVGAGHGARCIARLLA